MNWNWKAANTVMQLLVVLLAACASLRTAALIPAGTGAVPHALLPAAPTRWPRPLPWRAPVLRCGTVAESGGRLRGRGVALSGRSDPDAVTELLGLVAPGLEGNYSAAQRRRIDDLLDKLDAAGSGDTFLEAPSLRDFYRVQFTRDAARGTPVGGGFRYSALGRALFKTDDALQHVIDDQVVNMLFFRFLGIFPGGVVLRGTLARCPADERRAIEQKYSTPPPGLSSETIKVLFDQPRVFFGASGVLNFEVGPNTTVYLDTTYLDDRVRIGRWQPLSRHLLGRT